MSMAESTSTLTDEEDKNSGMDKRVPSELVEAMLLYQGQKSEKFYPNRLLQAATIAAGLEGVSVEEHMSGQMAKGSGLSIHTYTMTEYLEKHIPKDCKQYGETKPIRVSTHRYPDFVAKYSTYKDEYKNINEKEKVGDKTFDLHYRMIRFGWVAFRNKRNEDFIEFLKNNKERYKSLQRLVWDVFFLLRDRDITLKDVNAEHPFPKIKDGRTKEAKAEKALKKKKEADAKAAKKNKGAGKKAAKEKEKKKEEPQLTHEEEKEAKARTRVGKKIRCCSDDFLNPMYEEEWQNYLKTSYKDVSLIEMCGKIVEYRFTGTFKLKWNADVFLVTRKDEEIREVPMPGFDRSWLSSEVEVSDEADALDQEINMYKNSSKLLGSPIVDPNSSLELRDGDGSRNNEGKRKDEPSNQLSSVKKNLDEKYDEDDDKDGGVLADGDDDAHEERNHDTKPDDDQNAKPDLKATREQENKEEDVKERTRGKRKSKADIDKEAPVRRSKRKSKVIERYGTESRNLDVEPPKKRLRKGKRVTSGKTKKGVYLRIHRKFAEKQVEDVERKRYMVMAEVEHLKDGSILYSIPTNDAGVPPKKRCRFS